jgi:threonine/homoserine/homoserine lactone efflux protein
VTLTIFVAYCAAHFVAAVTPGPSMLAVIATGISRGFRQGMLVGIGVALGDLILLNIALLGLIALAQAFSATFLVAKYAGAAYFIWLGFNMWQAAGRLDPPDAGAQGDSMRALLLGLALALSNPKAILFHASLMPLIIDLKTLTLPDAFLIMSVVFVVNILTMGTYAFLAGRSARWFNTGLRLSCMNRIAGGAMIGTGTIIASR